jgi:transposase
MSGKRYSEDFKIEAIKQITERNYPIGLVSKRLGTSAAMECRTRAKNLGVLARTLTIQMKDW